MFQQVVHGFRRVPNVFRHSSGPRPTASLAIEVSLEHGWNLLGTPPEHGVTCWNTRNTVLSKTLCNNLFPPGERERLRVPKPWWGQAPTPPRLLGGGVPGLRSCPGAYRAVPGW